MSITAPLPEAAAAAPLADSDGLIQSVRAEIAALGPDWPQSDGQARLKALLERGRDAARLALEAGHGRGCARRLSRLMDAVVAMLAEAAARRFLDGGAMGFALAAQGGYGRGTLAPRSDIDLLFLTRSEPSEAQCRAVEAVLYPLWDLGLTVGHATRSLDDCIRQVRADMTTRTAFLDLRHLWGDEALADQAMTRFRREVVAGSVPEFVAAKLAERDARHSRHGASRYVVEPDVKDGKGGLRDLHTLFWIAKYAYAADTAEKMVALGLYSPEERRTFARCADFLWAARCHLHFLTGRETDRLSFDVQPEIARRMAASGFGQGAGDGLALVEAVMKQLLHRRQAGRRPHQHRLGGAGGAPAQEQSRPVALPAAPARSQAPGRGGRLLMSRRAGSTPTRASSRAIRSRSSACSAWPTGTTSPSTRRWCAAPRSRWSGSTTASARTRPPTRSSWRS